VGAAAIALWPQRPTAAPTPAAHGAADAAATSTAPETAAAPADVSAPIAVAEAPPAPAASGAAVADAAPPTAADAAPPAAADAVASAPAPSAARDDAGATAAPLALRTRESSWIEVSEAGGHKLVSRTLVAGETLALDGRFPLRLTIGNAAATELSLRGRPVDLSPHVRDNIARLELR
jgi:cytoskeleton protein RodZ